MSTIVTAVTQLRRESKQAQHQLEKLDEAIRVLENLNGRTHGGTRRNLSVAARKRIAEAQKARWAKWRTKQRKKAA